jgi:hypothetical protein
LDPVDDLAWLEEKSRGELTNLLARADALIKERKTGMFPLCETFLLHIGADFIVDFVTELNITSAACKSLYKLKTKHEALIGKIPLSPPSLNTNDGSNPSPGSTGSPIRPALPSLARSTSDFVVGSPSPEQTLSKSYGYNPRRGVSVPTALDISFLADQNAELLSKLDKLESEATSADLVGRRELRRLEKEIGILKEELEKTQTRSDELEEKAKAGFGLGAKKVIEEAWKNKQEREARIKAIKNKKSVRDDDENSAVRNFAPDTPSMFRTAATRQYPGPDLSTLEEVSSFGEDMFDISEPRQSPQPDQQLIAKLLEKIQELEATNSKILEHQTETTSRLQAVQRETEFMTKVYERLHELNDRHDNDETEAMDHVLDGLVNRFSKSHRALQSQLLAAKVKRQRSFHKRETQTRNTVMGMFDESAAELSTPQKPKSNLPVPFSEGPRNRRRHQSSYSIGSGGLVSPALSTLSLYSPPRRLREELAPDDLTGPSLANELGDQWDKLNSTSRLRPRSLSELSVLSASPSRPVAPIQPNEIQASSLPTPPGPTNSLQLSIEPPTPQKGSPALSHTQHQESLLIGNMSPGFRVSRSLRARNYFCIEGRYPEPLALSQSPQRRMRFVIDDSSPTPSRGPSSGRPLFVEAFHVMMDEFDGRDAGVQRESRPAGISRSPSPDVEDYADAKEELDERETTHVTTNVRAETTVEDEGQSYSEENSVSATSQSGDVSKSTLGGIVVELWMWLQFVIIMLVFLWAMAKKGPKSVLKDAERKRTLSMKKRV